MKPQRGVGEGCPFMKNKITLNWNAGPAGAGN